MEHRQTWYLLKIVFFVERQNVFDAIVLHNDTVDDVSYLGVKFRVLWRT